MTKPMPMKGIRRIQIFIEPIVVLIGSTPPESNIFGAHHFYKNMTSARSKYGNK